MDGTAKLTFKRSGLLYKLEAPLPEDVPKT
jgi:hypothetical protein